MILWHYSYQLWYVKVPNSRRHFRAFRSDAEKLLTRYNRRKAAQEAQ